jgi:hypothetical protein
MVIKNTNVIRKIFFSILGVISIIIDIISNMLTKPKKKETSGPPLFNGGRRSEPRRGLRAGVGRGVSESSPRHHRSRHRCPYRNPLRLLRLPGYRATREATNPERPTSESLSIPSLLDEWLRALRKIV